MGLDLAYSMYTEGLTASIYHARLQDRIYDKSYSEPGENSSAYGGRIWPCLSVTGISRFRVRLDDDLPLNIGRALSIRRRVGTDDRSGRPT